MNKKTILLMTTLTVIALVIAVWQLSNKMNYATAIYEVVRNESGYQPAELTISRGDTVRFINGSGDYHWPASDLHPTHSIYPDFDPRRPIATGKIWEFSFDQAGEWKFHDHLKANITGIINVKVP